LIDVLIQPIKFATVSISFFQKRRVIMQLINAKLCVNCDEIFEGETCPICGASDVVVWIHTWLPALNAGPGDRYVSGEGCYLDRNVKKYNKQVVK